MISLGIVIIPIKLLEDDSAEMSGFWYPEKERLPRTREHRRLVLEDLEAGRCRKVNLIGTVSQIEQILLSCDWEAGVSDTWFPSMEKAIDVAKRYRAIGVAFDNLLKPKGTSVCKTVRVCLTEDISSGVREFSNRGEAVLRLAYDWNVMEDFQEG